MNTHKHIKTEVTFDQAVETRFSTCSICKSPISSMYIDDSDRLSFWTDWKVA